MKKRGILATGIAVGMLASMGIQAFAGDAIQQITAYINDSFQFQVNGEAKTLDDEYHVLVYNDRSYLPVRGLGDMLGADINWDAAAKTISIKTNNDTTTAPGIDTETPATDTVNYKALPQTHETSGYRLTVTSYSSNLGSDKISRVYFRLTATGDDVVRVNPSKIAISADGYSYINYSSDVNMSDQDSKLYSTYASKDNDLESYITLPTPIKGSKNMSITIPVVTDTYRGQVTDTVSFDINVGA